MKGKSRFEQPISLQLSLTIENAIKAFIEERKSRHLSQNTIEFYKDLLDEWQSGWQLKA